MHDTPRHSALFSRPLKLPLATWIIGVALLALVPMLLFSALAVHHQISVQQAEGEEALRRRASLAAVAIGNELEGVFLEVGAIAETDAMLRGDLPALHALAVRMVTADPRLTLITLSQADGEILWSTSHALGSPLPRSTVQPFLASVLAQNRRSVSALYTGSIIRKQVVSVALPVSVGKQGRFVLRATVLASYISETLNEQGWPADWTAAVVDQSNVIIARSRDADRFVGQPATPSLQEGFRAGRPLFRAATKDGIATVVSAVAVPGTQWYVAVGSPLAALNAQVRDSMLNLLLAGVVCAVLGTGGALLLATRLGRQLRQLVDAHVRGEAPPMHRIAVREVAELASELTAARTQAQHAADALQLARQDALVKLTERSDMLDVLAHEVRQPLNNASAALQAASATLQRLGNTAVEEPLRRGVAVLSDVQASIDNTLATASLLVGAERAHAEDTDIDTLLAVAIRDLPAAEAGRVRIERATGTRTVTMDGSLMRLALRNLLSNALRYSPRDQPVVLRVADSDAPLALLIDVIDRGPGIAPELLGQMFDRGGRRPQSAGARRQGLGLYIVRRVMELHGGTVSLERNGAGGTTMRLAIVQGGDH